MNVLKHCYAFLIHLQENVFILQTMLSSTYHFWGVHNLYQALSAKVILESKLKLVCFSFFIFRFSLLIFHYSFFAFHFSLFIFVFFAFCFWFFYILNRAEYGILKFQLRPNIVFPHSKSYFDIIT